MSRYLIGGELDVHGLAVEWDSVVLLEGFLGVGDQLEDDPRGAQGGAVAVVVDVGPLQLAKLDEQFLGGGKTGVGGKISKVIIGS